ncbi:MAG: extracellular solute-binding protein [Capsulimonas sp.]|uniref:ABC transporter substrate-binding protein n=1 Tax=Capsulimonas sp. TaxID=2494211 RepID=UPI0032669E3B
MKSFPFGNATLCILLLTLLSGLWIAVQPAPQRPVTLTYWVFARPHYDAYRRVIPQFERDHPGVTVDLQLVSNSALATRLQAAFQADLDVPDLCELEIGSAGTMFRGPLKDVGFINLKPRLEQSGLYDRIVRARFAPYTSRGEIFGMPHDVHPVQIAYRRDLFEKYGVDPGKIQTWDDFIAAGRKITIPGKQYMIELSDSDSVSLESFLLQRGGGYFDSAGNVILDNEAAVKTMEFYVPLVAGPHKIGNTVGDMYGAQFGKALEDGYEMSFLCPDWRSRMVEDNYGRLSGKMALMPLPAVALGGTRTTTWGGTMVGITKRCHNPDLAWALVQYLYTDKAQLAQRFSDTNILPPLEAAWKQPAFQRPNPFWSGQRLGASYVELAPQVPPRFTAPEIDTAQAKLSEALVTCAAYYNRHGGDSGFDPFVRSTLRQCADRVRAVKARNPY